MGYGIFFFCNERGHKGKACLYWWTFTKAGVRYFTTGVKGGGDVIWTL